MKKMFSFAILTSLSLLLLGFLTMFASAQAVNIDILSHYVLGLQNGFMPYIMILVVLAAIIMMFPEAREFLGGLIKR